MRTMLVLVFGAGLLALGCKGEDDAAKGRGTAACQDFQDAVCDFAADHCHVSERGTCDHAFQGIECKSDAVASACANSLNDAACGAAVPTCDLSQIIDTQPAIAHCQELIAKLCAHLAQCGQTASLDSCLASPPTGGLDCLQAASVGLGYEDCLQQIDDWSCGAQTPRICSEVIGILPAPLGSAM